MPCHIPFIFLSGHHQLPGDACGLIHKRDRDKFGELPLEQLERFTLATGVAVCFCDSESPWQRGINENVNRLLRQ